MSHKIKELEDNFKSAFRQLESEDNYTVWLDVWNHWLNNPEAVKFLESSTEYTEPNIVVARHLTRRAQELIDQRKQT